MSCFCIRSYNSISYRTHVVSDSSEDTTNGMYLNSISCITYFENGLSCVAKNAFHALKSEVPRVTTSTSHVTSRHLTSSSRHVASFSIFDESRHVTSFELKIRVTSRHVILKNARVTSRHHPKNSSHVTSSPYVTQVTNITSHVTSF